MFAPLFPALVDLICSQGFMFLVCADISLLSNTKEVRYPDALSAFFRHCLNELGGGKAAAFAVKAEKALAAAIIKHSDMTDVVLVRNLLVLLFCFHRSHLLCFVFVCPFVGFLQVT